MKNLLAYTPEPFDNLELENFEHAPVANEGEMEDEGPRKGKRFSQSARRIAGRGRMPLLSKRVRQIKPSFRPKFPVIPFAPPRIGSAASVNVFPPPADDRRPSGQSSSSGNAGGEGSFGNAPAQDVSSEHVRWVQDALNRALGLRLIVDGIMNRETRSAVRMFQERKGLPVTGLVGPDTEEALRAEGGQAAAEPELLEGEWEMPECSCGGREMEEFIFEAEPVGGAKFEELEQWEEEIAQNSPQKVRWIQESLNKILGLRLKIDGIMGPQTRSAIRSFQRKQGLTADGTITLQTERTLQKYFPPTVPEMVLPGITIRGRCPKGGKGMTIDGYWKDVDEIHGDEKAKDPINRGQYPIFKEIVEIISDSFHPGCTWVSKIKLFGHTSRDGSPQYNMNLAERRAKKLALRLKAAIIKEVIARNYPTSHIEAAKKIKYMPIPIGPSEPVVANANTEEKHLLNRRVVVFPCLVNEMSC